LARWCWQRFIGDMSDNYTSVLFCIRDNGTEIYQNGLPVGVVKNAFNFIPHGHELPDGTKKPVKVDRVAVLQVIHAATAAHRFNP